MTLEAPRSRQGKATLALAFIAAIVASVGALLWANAAQADISPGVPGTTVTVTDNVAGVGPVSPGQQITYTVVIDANGVGGVTTNTVFAIDADPNLFPLSFNTAAGGFDNAECVIGVGPPGAVANSVTCTDPAGPLVDDTITIVYVVVAAPGFPNIANPSNCFVDDDGAGTPVGGIDCTYTDLAHNLTGLTGSASNLVGVAHTIDFILPVGFTCESDAGLDDGLRSCVQADLSIVNSNGATADTAAPLTLDDTNLNNPATASVTVNSPTAGTVTVTLAVKFDPQDDIAFVDSADPVFTKTYTTLAGLGDAKIVHVDVDDGTEDVAGDSPRDFDADQIFDPDGEWYPLDERKDNDDLTGSWHRVCLITAGLGAGDDALLDWRIENTTANPQFNQATEEPADDGVQFVADVNGEGTILDDDEANCVQWFSTQPGSQRIDVQFIPTLERIGWDDPATQANEGDDQPAPQPLIKEWNDLDETHIALINGDVGDDNPSPGDLTDNTGSAADWGNRDCVLLDPTNDAPTGFCDTVNRDGTVITIEGAEFNNGTIFAGGATFLEYIFGDHLGDTGLVDYRGPVDGAVQTFTFSGCGSARVEDPETGLVVILTNGQSVTVVSSDKGVAFQILPTNNGDQTTTQNNSDCEPFEQATMTIDTIEPANISSRPRDEANTEEVTVEWIAGFQADKQPLLSWAGQRTVLEHDWRQPDGSCPWNGDTDTFFVRYILQQQSVGSIINDPSIGPIFQVGQDFVIVEVDKEPTDSANSDCISRVIVESEDPGEFDASAQVVFPGFNQSTPGGLNIGDQWVVESLEYDFVVYFMKFEDVTLSIVDGSRQYHNDGTFSPANPTSQRPAGLNDEIEPDGADADTAESNVSADVLVRITVRGWVQTTNCPQRPEEVDANLHVKPANRCIFPDDWPIKFGDDTQFDLWGGSIGGCSNVAGPFSLLDEPGCGDSKAPHVNGGFRQTTFPNGSVTWQDAPMPPAEAELFISGTGYIKPADKDSIYTNSNNIFANTHIPAEPWISIAGSNYLWRTWENGLKSGLYHFWTSLGDSDPSLFGDDPLVSCPQGGNDPDCDGGVEIVDDAGDPNGFTSITVYTDNNGEAMAWVNGDYNTDLSNCASSPASAPAGLGIFGIDGYYCPNGTNVGTATLQATIDYPDKRKHREVDTNTVTIDWTWGGIKEVTVEQGGDFTWFIIFHVLDRDGYCGAIPGDPRGVSPSFHPVLGELVEWIIDDGDGGLIIDGEANVTGVPADLGDLVTTVTFHAAANPGIAQDTVDADECQSWVEVSASLGSEVDIRVTAHDPEGIIDFDVILNEDSDDDGIPDVDDNCVNVPNFDQSDVDDDNIGDVCDTEGPAGNADCDDGFDNDGDGDTDEQDSNCVATPGPTPATQEEIWGDVDCSDSVSPLDSLKVLLSDAGGTPPQGASCPGMNENIVTILQNGNSFDNEIWSDADCNGQVTPLDALKILLYDAGAASIQQSEPCPDIGSEVDIPVQ